MKIPVIQNAGCLRYYASSPNYNFLAYKHPDFEAFPIDTPADLEKARAAAKVAGCALTDDGQWRNLLDLKIPIFAIQDDLHYWDQAKKEMTEQTQENCALVFADYMLSHPNLEITPGAQPRDKRSNFVFCPNQAQGTIAPQWVPWEKRKFAKAPGTINPKIYPFRTMAAALPDIDSQQTVQTRFDKMDEREQSRFREGFITHMSQYKVGITCNSVLGYTVAKYFELPLAGCLLVAADIENSFEKYLYGFDNLNSVLLRKEHYHILGDILRAIKTCDPNNVIWRDTAIAGQKLILERHTIVQRMNMVSSVIKAFLGGGYQGFDQWEHFVNSWGSVTSHWGN